MNHCQYDSTLTALAISAVSMDSKYFSIEEGGQAVMVDLKAIAMIVVPLKVKVTLTGGLTGGVQEFLNEEVIDLTVKGCIDSYPVDDEVLKLEAILKLEQSGSFTLDTTLVEDYFVKIDPGCT